MKKIIFYMFRWQLSTPILAVVPTILLSFNISNFWGVAALSNLIGSLIFFWVDKKIFSNN